MAERDTIIINPETGGVHRTSREAFDLVFAHTDNPWVLASSSEGQAALNKLKDEQLRRWAADAGLDSSGARTKKDLVGLFSDADTTTTAATGGGEG